MVKIKKSNELLYEALNTFRTVGTPRILMSNVNP